MVVYLLDEGADEKTIYHNLKNDKMKKYFKTFFKKFYNFE